MFVIYSSRDEVLVTTKKRERKMLEEFFDETCGRDKDDYDRKEVSDSCVEITNNLSAW